MLLAWPFNRVAPSMNSFQSIRPWWLRFWKLYDYRVVPYVIFPKLKWNFETILDGQPHAIRFSYFGEPPECLTPEDKKGVCEKIELLSFK